MRRTKEDTAKTRQALVASALEVFARKGYSATRLDDIAELANVTRGAVYHHFGDKRGAYLAATEAPAERLQEAMAGALSDDGSARANLERLFLAVLNIAANDQDVCRMLELQWLRTEMVEEFRQDTVIRRQDIKAQIAGISVLIEQVNPGSNKDVLALAVGYIGLMTGLLQTWLVLDKEFPLKNQGLAVIRAYLNGM